MHRASRSPTCSFRPSRLALTTLAAVLLHALTACQTYRARPLDLPGHYQQFLSRAPESSDARAGVALIAPSHPGLETFEPTDGVSCLEAEALAIVFNADLRVARLRAGVAHATARNAGLWEDPTLGVDLERILQSTPQPWRAVAGLGITIPISGRLRAEKSSASAVHAVELAKIAQLEWSTRVAVRRAWCQWNASQSQLTATTDFLSRTDQVIAIVDTMEEFGEMARSEARLFRIERATKASELTLLKARALDAELRLRQLMGVSPQAPLLLVADRGPATTPTDDARSQDPHPLQQRCPALIVAMAEYDAAEAVLEMQIRKQWPDLHIGPGFGREDGDDRLVLGLSLPVPLFNANRQAIAEASAQRDAARASAEAALEQTVARIHAATLWLDAARQHRSHVQHQIVPLADEQYAEAREVARLGQSNALILLESLSRQHEAQVSLIIAQRDEALARADLDELLGPAHADRPPDHTPSIGTPPGR